MGNNRYCTLLVVKDSMNAVAISRNTFVYESYTRVSDIVPTIKKYELNDDH